jgi:hypothetical protein
VSTIRYYSGGQVAAIAISTAVFGFLAGVFATMDKARKDADATISTMEDAYNEDIMRVQVEARRHYEAALEHNRVLPVATYVERTKPDPVYAAAAAAMIDYQGITAPPPVAPKVSVTVMDEFPEPYVIPQDQFFNSDSGYARNLTITYYTESNVVVDEADNMLDDETIERLIGRDNLSRFGQQSTDANVVYVRNERVKTDFEVIRDSGTYEEISIEDDEG